MRTPLGSLADMNGAHLLPAWRRPTLVGRRARGLFVAWSMALQTWLWSAAAAAATVGEQIEQVQAALDDWQLDEAVRLANELNEKLPDVPPVQAVLGAVKFHQGDYDGALRFLRRAAEGGVTSPLFPLVQSTQRETAGFVTVESAHFVVRMPPGKDEVLGDIALWALERAYEQVSRAFAYAPRHKIPVDILHDASGLANVSTLTVKEIETSGTIALCKYNRLMITSPKALARGYSWLDTLSHEFVHLVVSEKSANTVPIWLHEGLAKYSESLWRGEPGLALDPASENLLAKAVKQNKLITFAQMHPSMAKLPSQEDTALAFAEVFTVIEFLHAMTKEKTIEAAYAPTNELLDGLRAGKTMDAALRAAVGKDLLRLQRAWTRYLKARPFKLQPGAQPRKLTFVRNARGASDDDEVAESEAALSEMQGREGRKYVRIGNLLRERGRTRAAVVEYEKALAEMTTASPALQNRLAGLYIELEDGSRAKALLEATQKVFPDDPQTHILLGRIALREERWQDSATHYRRATWENPFNPEIHMALYRIGEALGDADMQDTSKRNITRLSGHAQQNPELDAEWRVRAGDPFGSVDFRSSPWGDVYIDGRKSQLTTPVVDLQMKPGTYQVRVWDPVSGKMGQETLAVRAGEQSQVSLTLRRLTPAEREAMVAAARALPPPGASSPAAGATDGASAAPGPDAGEPGAEQGWGGEPSDGFVP